MSSEQIRARMDAVRAAITTCGTAKKHVNRTMGDAQRLIKGAATASQSTRTLLGGAASGADRGIIDQLGSAADGGKRFSRQLQDVDELLRQRILKLEAEYDELSEQYRRALAAEAEARAAARRRTY